MNGVSSSGSKGVEAHRKDTLAFYQHATGRVIAIMRSRLDEPLNMQTLARTVHMSWYHFQHIFRDFTGITPARFLAALRVEKAKELLLTTDRSVTDICFDVGYNSLGTFSRIFTEFVCLSPSQFRRFATRCGVVNQLKTSSNVASRTPSSLASVEGRISGRVGFSGLVFIGLFDTPIPRKRPVGGTMAVGLGAYRIFGVPRGEYYVLAVAFPRSATAADYLLPKKSQVLVAAGESSAQVSKQGLRCEINLRLRETRVTDPPILVALPLLLLDR
jgi:AraC-like DNA-binding protein